MGMSALVHARGHSQFESDIGRQLFRWINLQLLVKDLAFNSNLAYHSWPKSAFPHDIGRSHSDAMRRIVDVSRDVQRIASDQDRSESATARLKQVSDRAASLAMELHSWQVTLLKVLSYQIISPPATRGLPVSFPAAVNIFPNLNEAIIWGNYWALCIRVLRSTAVCARRLHERGIRDHPLPCQEVILNRLGTCADNLRSTLPYLTSNIDQDGNVCDPERVSGNFVGAMVAVWTLNTLISTQLLHFLRPGVQEWGLQWLDHIGNTFSMKQCYAFRREHEMRIRQALAMHNTTSKR